MDLARFGCWCCLAWNRNSLNISIALCIFWSTVIEERGHFLFPSIVLVSEAGVGIMWIGNGYNCNVIVIAEVNHRKLTKSAFSLL